MISCSISLKRLNVIYDFIDTHSSRYSDIVEKVWYHTWYQGCCMISYMISNFFNPFRALFFVWFCIWYHIKSCDYWCVVLFSLAYCRWIAALGWQVISKRSLYLRNRNLTTREKPQCSSLRTGCIQSSEVVRSSDSYRKMSNFLLYSA